jgi:hypothetical protein
VVLVVVVVVVAAVTAAVMVVVVVVVFLCLLASSCSSVYLSVCQHRRAQQAFNCFCEILVWKFYENLSTFFGFGYSE